MNEWMKEYIEEFMQGKRKAANIIKQNNIPQKLYRYRNINENEIKALKKNQVWFSNPKNLNDPFDCNAGYYDESLLIEEISKRKLNFSPDKAISIIHDGLRNNMRLACFSESLFNMPLWAHYANNHKGMCIEYDLTELDIESELSQGLYPVLYEPNRYDITNLLKMSFEEKYDLRLSILFFLLLFKHTSWSYEQEWRILLLESGSLLSNNKGKLVNLPTPTAVYAGMNASLEDKEKIKAVIGEDTDLIKLKMENGEYFQLGYQ